MGKLLFISKNLNSTKQPQKSPDYLTIVGAFSKVELKPASYIIGKDTVASMRGGILFGYGAMCDSLVSKYRALLGRGVKVIATGGNAKLIKRYARSIQIVDEDLTLKSLALIRP